MYRYTVKVWELMTSSHQHMIFYTIFPAYIRVLSLEIFRLNANRRSVERRVAEIEAHYTKRAKKLDATFAAGNNSNPFLSAYKSYGMNGIF